MKAIWMCSIRLRLATRMQWTNRCRHTPLRPMTFSPTLSNPIHFWLVSTSVDLHWKATWEKVTLFIRFVLWHSTSVAFEGTVKMFSEHGRQGYRLAWKYLAPQEKTDNRDLEFAHIFSKKWMVLERVGELDFHDLHLQRADSFASISLTAMWKSLAATNTLLQRALSFASICSL